MGPTDRQKTHIVAFVTIKNDILGLNGITEIISQMYYYSLKGSLNVPVM
jgi:hypothetical protein